MTGADLLNSNEVTWLVMTLLLTSLYWVPYILNEILRAGPLGAMSSKAPWTIDLADWAQRCRRAHANQVENLAVFAPLAILVPLTGLSTEATGFAALVFFLARLGHYVVYTLGIPVLRTLTFVAGVGCQVYLALVLLGWQ